MPSPVTARYHASDGTEHLVSVARTAEGRWRVLDTAAGSAIIVETLTGHDDRQAQAHAIARDYAEEQQAFQLGMRTYDPLPKPRAASGDRVGAAMGSLTAAPSARAAGSGRPAANQSARSAMRIVRPQPAGSSRRCWPTSPCPLWTSTSHASGKRSGHNGRAPSTAVLVSRPTAFFATPTISW